MKKRKFSMLDNWLIKRPTSSNELSAENIDSRESLETNSLNLSAEKEEPGNENAREPMSLQISSNFPVEGDYDKSFNDCIPSAKSFGIPMEEENTLQQSFSYSEGDESSTHVAPPIENYVQSPKNLTELITDKPFQPDMVPCQMIDGNRCDFKPSWYKTFPWLHYESKLQKVLCFTCVNATLLHLHQDTAFRDEKFLTIGFNNWRKGPLKFKKHQGSKYHKLSASMIANLHQSPITLKIDSAALKSQEKARQFLQTMFTSIIFLAKQGLAFRGDDHDGGNLMELLKLRSNEIPGLSMWLKRSKSFTSWAIQNEILQIIAHSILRQIAAKIKNAKYFSLIVDETSDTSVMEQVSINIRCVDEDLETHEYFLGLYETASTTANSLANVIYDSMCRFNLSIDDLRGQCYDGAANMSGKFNGVRVKILEQQRKALYVHCFNHSLNLALQDSAKKLVFVRDVLTTVHEIGTMVRGSPKRMAMFGALCAQQDTTSLKPRPLCPTRWSVRVKSIQPIIASYDKVLVFLEEISCSNDHAASKAKGLLLQLEKGDYLLGMLITREIFKPCERLSKVLQTENATLFGSIEAANVTISELERMKTVENFERLWGSMIEKTNELGLCEPILRRQRSVSRRLKTFDVPRQFGSAKERLCSIYYEFIEDICGLIRDRFCQPSLDQYCKLEKCLLDYQKCDPLDAVVELQEICEFYEWNFENMKSQLDVLKNVECMQWDTIQNMANSFKVLKPMVRALFPDVAIYLKHVLVMPCSSAGAERSFSRLRRIKSYLRSTMTQERLNHCCVINAYADQLENLDMNEMMKEFISVRDRKGTFGCI